MANLFGGDGGSFNNDGSNNFGGNYGQNNNNNYQQQQPQQQEYKSKDLLYLQSLVGDASPFGRYYLKICQKLKDEGVPTTRLPTREHFLSRMFDSLDENKLSSWMVKYVDLEKIVVDDEDDKEDITKE